jgi:hypothetical protein
MNISQGLGAVYDYNLLQLAKGNNWISSFGNATPTAGESTIAQLRNQSADTRKIRVRKAFIIPGAVMNVNMAIGLTNYGSNFFSQSCENTIGAGSFAEPAGGHNAAPVGTILRAFPSVPTSGLLIDNIDFVFNLTSVFLFWGATVNTALSGTIWWQEYF